MNNLNLIFYGISHLSINYGVVSAKLNNKVYFFDTKKNINNYKNKKIIYDEPNLINYFNKYKKNIKFITKIPNNLNNSLIFIAVDINTNNNNVSDYKYINTIIKKLIKIIPNKDLPLIIMSQVKPTFTRNIDWPKNLLFYQVETLIFGDAIRRAENPERIITSTFDGNKIRNISYKKYLNMFKTKILVMKYEEAELCKMFINSYLVSNVTLTNNLAKICKELNLDWNKPKEALKLDKRIGKYSYLNPGLGISGGNLERDIVNLNNLNKQLNINTELFQTFINESKNQKKWLVETISKLIKNKFILKKTSIGILGIGYKENTNSIKNSPSLILINALRKYNLFCYDRLLNNKKILNYKIKWLSLFHIITNVDVLFIMHNEKKINSKFYKNHLLKNNYKVIIDPYRILDEKIRSKLINYVSL